jgi:hypothetical protein
MGLQRAGWTRGLLWAFLLFIAAKIGDAAALAPTAQNNPDFGPNVLVFDPSMTTIQKQIDAVYATQERGEFNANRCAMLFKPGKYSLDVKVGFYTQVAGLGESPDDVEITGAVRSKATWRKGNATVNFWRSAENLSVIPREDQNVNVWAVSQGTALRKVHIKGNLNLWDGGWSSGGFMADCKIDGRVNAGSQQQWISRNSEFAGWQGGAWNMVFVGVSHPPAGTWPDRPNTVIEQTPVIREKPYLVIDEAGRYFVRALSLSADGSQGITWGHGGTAGMAIPIDQFFLARADRDTSASINAALDRGMNLIFTPGVYHLQSSIHVSRPHAIVLGLGYPTLVPDEGAAAMTIDDVDGVEMGGFLFQAGKIESPVLLQVGQPGRSVSHAKDPSFLYDIFCRAGGAAVGSATSLVTVNSKNVVGDNFWLWRADHGRGAGWNANKNLNGLVVNGDDVTLYGLFVEHCQAYQTLWNGNGGRVYFYQSEMPYDPPSQTAWSHDGVMGYASYKVADTVTTHEAWGLGVYCVFYAAPVVSESAIETPVTPGVKMHHMIVLRFGGVRGSGIEHIINDEGSSVISSFQARMN